MFGGRMLISMLDRVFQAQRGQSFQQYALGAVRDRIAQNPRSAEAKRRARAGTGAAGNAGRTLLGS